MKGSTPEAIVLDVYTKRDCPLCDKAFAAIERVRARLPDVMLRVERRDIESNSLWLERYRTLIPILETAGERLCVYEVNERQL